MFTSVRQTGTALAVFVACLIGYVVYDQTFGELTQYAQIDPALLIPLSDEQMEAPTTKARREPEIAARRAFGPDCWEERAPNYSFRPRGGQPIVPGHGHGVYIYFDEQTIPPENPDQLHLSPFALAYIAPAADGNPENDQIYTVRGTRAVLQMPSKINLLKSSNSNERPVAAWIEGEIVLRDNRRSDDPKDDYIAFAENLRYQEAKNLLWADGKVRLAAEDGSLLVRGRDLEIELYPQPAPGAPTVKRDSQAKRIHLLQDVDFTLELDDRQDFLGGSGSSAFLPTADSEPRKASTAPSPGSGPPKKKTPVTILAKGPFQFDMETQQATFDKRVRVIRKAPATNGSTEPLVDQLEADRLQLFFERLTAKPEQKNTKPANKSPLNLGSGNLSLAGATATGEAVILISATQKLQATGNFLHHDVKLKRTILTGRDEMIALQENASIHARQLVIEQDPLTGNKLFADGPNGWLEVWEEKERKPGAVAQLTLRWKNRLSVLPVAGTEIRVIEVRQDVEAELPKEGISLTGDMVKVHVAPVETGEVDPATKKPKRKLEPIHLESEGKVAARSKELRVQTARLQIQVLYTRPTSPAAPIAPSAQGAPATAQNATATTSTDSVQAMATTTNSAVPIKKASGKAASAPVRLLSTKATNDPLDVRAEAVSLLVERVGSRSEPKMAIAEGDVLLTQLPRDGKKESVQIEGHILQFEREPGGDRAFVQGNARRPAVVRQFGGPEALTIVANHKLHFNELENTVKVEGPGYLERPVSSRIDGGKLAEPKKLRVEWVKSMVFDGKYAYFMGSVLASQESSHVKCSTMDVTFDERVDFKKLRERQPGDKAASTRASIERVDCDQEVYVVHQDFEANRIIRRTTLTAKSLRYLNVEGKMLASGPGQVRIVEVNRIRVDEAGKQIPPRLPFQLTRVVFGGRLDGQRLTETVDFYEDVRIIRSPISSVDEEPNESKLDPDALLVDADQAQVATYTVSKTVKQRDFRATGGVKFHARTYYGNCHQLKYEQAKDMLRFESQPNREVYFARQLVVGGDIEETRAEEVLYYPKTNKLSVGKTTGLEYRDAPGKASPRPSRP